MEEGQENGKKKWEGWGLKIKVSKEGERKASVKRERTRKDQMVEEGFRQKH